VSPLLALLHWPNFGGTIAGLSNSDIFGKILLEKKALVYILNLEMYHLTMLDMYAFGNYHFVGNII